MFYVAGNVAFVEQVEWTGAFDGLLRVIVQVRHDVS